MQTLQELARSATQLTHIFIHYTTDNRQSNIKEESNNICYTHELAPFTCI